MTEPLKIVLLAAGIGNRLGPLTEQLPKSLLPLGDKVILDYVMETLLAFPASEVIVVGGFAFEKLSTHLKHKDDRIRLIENKNYLQGSILTLECALPYLDSSFFLFNADHIYPQKIVPELLKNKNGIVGMCDFDRPLTDDDMKISLNAQNQITGISKKLSPYDGGYIGITFCSKEELPLYKSTAAEVIQQTEGKGVVENVLAKLIEKKHFPFVGDMSGIRWLEVDTPKDLAIAKSKINTLNN